MILKYLLIGLGVVVVTFVLVFLLYLLAVLVISCAKTLKKEVQKNDRDN